MSASSRAVVPGLDALRRCPGCGRENHPERVLCVTCGTDLETGRPPEDGAAKRLRRPTDDRLLTGLRGERTVLTGGGLILALAVIGLLVLLGVGPFAAAERLDRAVFLSSGYATPPTVLGVEQVATVTTMIGTADRSFSPLHLFDGEPGSVWLSDPEALEGGAERIRLELEVPAWVSRIELRNGDHGSVEDYGRNDRLLRGVLSVDGGRDFRIDLLDIGLQAQAITFAEPELTTSITIRVVRTFEAGGGPSGLALSEITVVGWPASAADAALARQRAQNS
jgi:hypothetical protein